MSIWSRLGREVSRAVRAVQPSSELMTFRHRLISNEEAMRALRSGQLAPYPQEGMLRFTDLPEVNQPGILVSYMSPEFRSTLPGAYDLQGAISLNDPNLRVSYLGDRLEPRVLEPITPEAIRSFESRFPDKRDPEFFSEQGEALVHRDVPREYAGHLSHNDGLQLSTVGTPNFTENIVVESSVPLHRLSSEGGVHMSRQELLQHPNTRISFTGDNGPQTITPHSEDINPYIKPVLSDFQPNVSHARVPVPPELERAVENAREKRASEEEIKMIKTWNATHGPVNRVLRGVTPNFVYPITPLWIPEIKHWAHEINPKTQRYDKREYDGGPIIEDVKMDPIRSSYSGGTHKVLKEISKALDVAPRGQIIDHFNLSTQSLPITLLNVLRHYGTDAGKLIIRPEHGYSITNELGDPGVYWNEVFNDENFKLYPELKALWDSFDPSTTPSLKTFMSAPKEQQDVFNNVVNKLYGEKYNTLYEQLKSIVDRIAKLNPRFEKYMKSLKMVPPEPSRVLLEGVNRVGYSYPNFVIEKQQQGGALKQNFIQRLEDPNRKSIPDWTSFKRNPLFNNRGEFTNNYVDDSINSQHPSISTHKMGYEYSPDDSGRAIVYPEVQEVNGKLVDFTRPPYHSWAGYDSALDRGDYLRMKDLEEARKWVEGYKSRYKNLK